MAKGQLPLHSFTFFRAKLTSIICWVDNTVDRLSITGSADIDDRTAGVESCTTRWKICAGAAVSALSALSAAADEGVAATPSAASDSNDSADTAIQYFVEQ